MSDRYTTVAVRGGGPGMMLHGRVDRSAAIGMYRHHYEQQIAYAQKALAATDDELSVTTHTGVYARRNVEEVTQ